jgi:hypothetical protein
MTHAQAVALLERKTSALSDPALSLDDIDLLLLTHRRADRWGTAPGFDGWEPTWDLDAAAAEGWRWKAAAIADRFGFSADGATFSRDQQWQHCMEMAGRFGARSIRSLDTSPFGDRFSVSVFPFEGLLP